MAFPRARQSLPVVGCYSRECASTSVDQYTLSWIGCFAVSDGQCPCGSCAKRTSPSLRKLTTADFEVSRISGAVTALYLSMLAENDARDWCDHHLRLDGKVHG